MIEEGNTLDLQTGLAQNVKALLCIETEDVEAIMKHYNVTIESLHDMVKHIKEWYKKQPHLPQGHLHDRQLLGFLLNKAFSVEQAKSNIDNFFTARSKMPELMCGRDPVDKAWLWYLQRFWYVLPKKTADNNRITVFRLDREESFIGIQAVKAGFLACEYRIWNDAALGDCWIMDFKYITLQQAMQMTPMLISKILYFWKSCLGIKLVSVHLLNLPSYGVTILDYFKKRLASKIVSRIHVTKAEDLLKIFSKDVLPKEYGGSGFSCKEIADEWSKNFQSKPWRNYLIEQDVVHTDESKRLTPSRADEIFGVNGSFKQLSFD